MKYIVLAIALWLANGCKAASSEIVDKATSQPSRTWVIVEVGSFYGFLVPYAGQPITTEALVDRGIFYGNEDQLIDLTAAHCHADDKLIYDWREVPKLLDAALVSDWKAEGQTWGGIDFDPRSRTVRKGNEHPGEIQKMDESLKDDCVLQLKKMQGIRSGQAGIAVICTKDLHELSPQERQLEDLRSDQRYEQAVFFSTWDDLRWKCHLYNLPMRVCVEPIGRIERHAGYTFTDVTFGVFSRSEVPTDFIIWTPVK